MILWFHMLANCCANHVDSTFPVAVMLFEVVFHAVKYSHAEPFQDATHFPPKEIEADIGGTHRQDEGH